MTAKLLKIPFPPGPKLLLDGKLMNQLKQTRRDWVPLCSSKLALLHCRGGSSQQDEGDEQGELCLVSTELMQQLLP
jgi:hypothetical protein